VARDQDCWQQGPLAVRKFYRRGESHVKQPVVEGRVTVVESDSPPGTAMSRTLDRAGSLIGKLKLSKEMADPETRARAAWTLAAGKKIAEHTLASALVRGTLVVEVTDIVWQKQLNTLRHFLLRNLKDALGEDLVTEIDFRPMRHLVPERRKPQRAETVRQMPAGSEGIQDPVMAMLYRQSKRRG
jgi:predicted nucleic acid-binding Zn ribbon protein